MRGAEAAEACHFLGRKQALLCVFQHAGKLGDGAAELGFAVFAFPAGMLFVNAAAKFAVLVCAGFRGVLPRGAFRCFHFNMSSRLHSAGIASQMRLISAVMSAWVFIVEMSILFVSLPI